MYIAALFVSSLLLIPVRTYAASWAWTWGTRYIVRNVPYLTFEILKLVSYHGQHVIGKLKLFEPKALYQSEPPSVTPPEKHKLIESEMQGSSGIIEPHCYHYGSMDETGYHLFSLSEDPDFDDCALIDMST